MLAVEIMDQPQADALGILLVGDCQHYVLNNGRDLRHLMARLQERFLKEGLAGYPLVLIQGPN